MIIVTGEFRFPEGSGAAVDAAMIEMTEATVKEAGCLHYRFYRDIERPDAYRVYEEWESEDALASHAASAHMQVYRARLKEIGVLSRRVKKFEAGPATEL